MIRAGGTSRRLFITVKKQSFCGSKSMNQANEELIPVILVCLRTTEPDDEFDHAIEELRSLVEACGLKDVGIVTQTLPHLSWESVAVSDEKSAEDYRGTCVGQDKSHPRDILKAGQNA